MADGFICFGGPLLDASGVPQGLEQKALLVVVHQLVEIERIRRAAGRTVTSSCGV